MKLSVGTLVLALSIVCGGCSVDATTTPAQETNAQEPVVQTFGQLQASSRATSTGLETILFNDKGNVEAYFVWDEVNRKGELSIPGKGSTDPISFAPDTSPTLEAMGDFAQTMFRAKTEEGSHTRSLDQYVCSVMCCECWWDNGLVCGWVWWC